MNKNIIKSILDNREKFIPLLFTSNQMNILHKYFAGMKLTYNEQHTLYTSIKKRLDALEIFSVEKEPLYINGRDKVINERIEKAKEIIKKFSPKCVFVGGSFLFKENYNDIDVFVLQEKGHKEIREGNLHIVKLTKKRLENPVFQSAAKIAISNFYIPNEVSSAPLKLNDIMSAYHESVIEVMNKEKREITRNLTFNYFLLIENRILDGLELKKNTQSLSLEQIEVMVRAMIQKKFSNNYLYVALHDYIKSLDTAINSEKSNKNLIRYRNFYEEMIHEARRGKAEAA